MEDAFHLETKVPFSKFIGTLWQPNVYIIYTKSSYTPNVSNSCNHNTQRKYPCVEQESHNLGKAELQKLLSFPRMFPLH